MRVRAGGPSAGKHAFGKPDRIAPRATTVSLRVL